MPEFILHQVGERMSRRLLVRKDDFVSILLSGVFILSFLPYVTTVNTKMLLIGPVSLITLAVITLMSAPAKGVARIIAALRRWRFLLLAFVVPVLPTMIAALNNMWYALLYTLLMTAVLCATQVLLAILSFQKIAMAFARAGLICIVIFMAMSLKQILRAAISASRFIPASAQPNAIGFIFAGFVAAMILTIFIADRNIISRALYILAVLGGAATIFVASSRASMLALFLGCAYAVMIYAAALFARGRASKRLLITSLAIFIFGITTLIVLRISLLENAVKYISDFLQLNSRYRGFGSGFSGRTERWETTLNALERSGTWLFGSGYRTSGIELGFSVDNGYLTLWYESGLIGILYVVGQMFWLLSFSSRQFLRHSSNDVKTRALFLIVIIIVLLVNNFFDRYLFGFGNPFSILALFVILLRRADLIESEPTAHFSRGKVQ
jgi:hypothetical protein